MSDEQEQQKAAADRWQWIADLVTRLDTRPGAGRMSDTTILNMVCNVLVSAATQNAASDPPSVVSTEDDAATLVAEAHRHPHGHETRERLLGIAARLAAAPDLRGIARRVLSARRNDMFNSMGYHSIDHHLAEMATALGDPPPPPRTETGSKALRADAPSDAGVALRNLLARIHRDGGHHTAEVGWCASLADADTKIGAWLERDDRWATLEAAAKALPMGKAYRGGGLHDAPMHDVATAALRYARGEPGLLDQISPHPISDVAPGGEQVVSVKAGETPASSSGAAEDLSPTATERESWSDALRAFFGAWDNPNPPFGWGEVPQWVTNAVRDLRVSVTGNPRGKVPELPASPACPRWVGQLLRVGIRRAEQAHDDAQRYHNLRHYADKVLAAERPRQSEPPCGWCGGTGMQDNSFGASGSTYRTNCERCQGSGVALMCDRDPDPAPEAQQTPPAPDSRLTTIDVTWHNVTVLVQQAVANEFKRRDAIVGVSTLTNRGEAVLALVKLDDMLMAIEKRRLDAASLHNFIVAAQIHLKRALGDST